MPLAARHARFVEEYLVDLNATEAYVRSGGKARGKAANVTACRWMAREDVQEAIKVAMAKRSERTGITQDMVLEEYAKLAFLDPRRFFDEHGNLIDVHKLPADVAAALGAMDVTVEKVSENEEGKPQFAMVRKIKFADKKGALDSVARCLGMFKDKIGLEHSGKIDLTTEQTDAALAAAGLLPPKRADDGNR